MEFLKGLPCVCEALSLGWKEFILGPW
jgi:hypothetical protein